MVNGYIEKERRITETESLVLLRIQDSDATTHYVAVVMHPQGETVSFRSIERAEPDNTETLFALRTMFNCRQADKIIHKDNEIVFSEPVHLVA